MELGAVIVVAVVVVVVVINIAVLHPLARCCCKVLLQGVGKRGSPLFSPCLPVGSSDFRGAVVERNDSKEWSFIFMDSTSPAALRLAALFWQRDGHSLAIGAEGTPGTRNTQHP